MAIRKRGEHYFIDYYVNGRRVREVVGTKKKQAEDALSKRKVEIIEGKFFDKRRIRKIHFEELADEFIELHSRVNKKKMVAKRDENLIANLKRTFGGKYLHEITPMMIERFKAARRESVAPATVNRELACLKCMFNKAIQWGRYDDNPVRRVRLFRENNQRTRYLESDEIQKLLENCQENIKPILIVALNTGMRKGEILNLKWENVDLERGIIYLLDTKNSEKREVIMNGPVKEALSKLTRHATSPYVFYKEDGAPYKDVRKYYETTLKKCGIIGVRFHDLRHTFASHLVMSGVDLKTVQELMGHKSIEMTLRYSHLSPDHKKKAVDLLGEKIGTKWAQKQDAGNEGK